MEVEGVSGGGESWIVAGIERKGGGERGFEGRAALAKHRTTDVLQRESLDVQIEGWEHIAPCQTVSDAVATRRALERQCDAVGKTAHAALFEVIFGGSGGEWRCCEDTWCNRG